MQPFHQKFWFYLPALLTLRVINDDFTRRNEYMCSRTQRSPYVVRLCCNQAYTGSFLRLLVSNCGDFCSERLATDSKLK